MVAIVTGKGTGLERSSAFVLGSQGQLGSSLQGRGGDGVFVNAASGNLVITRQDEFLIGLGPDAAISRTYNSLATVGDGDNNDNWRASVYRQVTGLSGTYGASGTTVKRIDWDGSETLYTWDANFISTGVGAYVAKDGDGAYDTLVYGSSQWTWQDGDSRIRDIYNSSGKLTSTSDLDGNSLTYTYSGSLITRITTQNGEYTNLTYNSWLLPL
jgi:YD repeat-containing protein